MAGVRNESQADSICGDEKAITAIGVLERATAWFADRGVTVERVFSNNGSAYRSHAWQDACAALGIQPKRTRTYRPQTNGKIERFHRTLADGWAYARFYGSESERRAALPGWLHFYNHHRHHSAIGAAPISRLNNLSGHHSYSASNSFVVNLRVAAFSRMVRSCCSVKPSGWIASMESEMVSFAPDAARLVNTSVAILAKSAE